LVFKAVFNSQGGVLWVVQKVWQAPRAPRGPRCRSSAAPLYLG